MSSSTWTPPSPPEQTPLLLNNTIAQSAAPVEFHPISSSKLVKWYTCGPTVYDSSHLGHARNYVTIDIMRRIIEDYLGYDITFVMNVTDVDDKIILRARRDYLFEQYMKEGNPLKDVIEMVEKSLGFYITSINKKIAKLEEAAKGVGEAAATAGKEKILVEGKKEELVKAVNEQFAIAKGTSPPTTSSSCLLEAAKDAVSLYLDDLKGDQFSDHEAIKKHALKYEEEFLADMKTLGVKPVDVLTRVSEYVPEVIEYVQKIIKNGYGYVADSGSVYFDTHKFNDSPSHTYCKLDPSKFANSEANLKLLAEGEGALSTAAPSEKKNPQDFALWKASKPGEPVWDSPWGAGRPGWHIECSAMASFVLGDKIDIHSGGIDLKFPHHDNEIAQAEAYFDHGQWTNYWLHTGHLDINGLKMSKSLKNFITIREALEGTPTCPKFSPRELRIMFLLSGWDKKMDFQFDSLEEVKQYEKTISEFFLGVNNVMREEAEEEKTQSWRKEELDLNKQTEETMGKVDAALRKNLNYKDAFKLVLGLIKSANGYMQDKSRRGLLLRKVGAFVFKILKVFGLTNLGDGYTFALASVEDNGKVNKEEILPPYLNALSNFRQNVRDNAKKNAPHGVFLQECDQLRDKVMPPLGVRLMDDGAFPYSLADPAVLMKEIEEKEAQERKQRETKLKKKIAALERDLKKFEEWKQHPRVFFATEKYSQFTEEGKPTHKQDGEELSKNEKKKVDKDWGMKSKNHEKYLKKEQEESGFLEKMKADLEALKEELKQ